MEAGVDYYVRSICSEDRVKNFRSGSAEFQPLKTFLIRDAWDFHSKEIAKTYVAINLNKEKKEDENSCVLGYITLTCSEIDVAAGNLVENCPPQAMTYDSLPAVKIARLAVDSRHRKKCIGNSLISLAVAIAVDQIASNIGCRFVITDAKTDAVRFYENAGFTMLDTEENKESETPVMFLDILKTEEDQE